MSQESVSISVDGGSVPTAVLRPAEPQSRPALVVIPSIFGPAPDLVAQLEEIGDAALVVVADPFWRTGEGAVPYNDMDTAFGRLAEFDVDRCHTEMSAVVDWAAQNSNGRVVGLGICFGGPYVFRFAADDKLAGGVTWHGSRLEDHLDRADEISCPLALHFGDADPITPPEVIGAVQAAFAGKDKVSIVVHPGASHGFSHDGDAYDETAYRAGFGATLDLLVGFGS